MWDSQSIIISKIEKSIIFAAPKYKRHQTNNAFNILRQIDRYKVKITITLIPLSHHSCEVVVAFFICVTVFLSSLCFVPSFGLGGLHFF